MIQGMYLLPLLLLFMAKSFETSVQVSVWGDVTGCNRVLGTGLLGSL